MMDYPIHNPRDISYRSNPGAAALGTQLTLRIAVPHHYQTSRVTLLADWEPGGEHRRIPMTREPDTDCDRFCTVLEPFSRTGQLFYAFELLREGGLPYCYGAMNPTPEHPDITGGIYPERPPRWQVTVYDPAGTAPDWFGEGITYQIFPDRFHRSRMPAVWGYTAPRRVHERWDETPDCPPDGINIKNDDFFGGDLQGIIEKLLYLKDLGVTTLYLNPIFSARSNHRYDTADYRSIDPMLGTRKDLEELCSRAAALGMHIMLDGVFNHTGNDSIYFNAYGTYGDGGASRDRNSPYRPWYHFRKWPYDYDCWWDIPSLPAIKGDSAAFASFLLDEDGVIPFWMAAGVSGWRLDVADELPEPLIAGIRRAVTQSNPEAVIIGEVWEDASNKVSYGTPRNYFGGDELDGVMNYPLRDAVLAFLRGGDAFDFRLAMERLCDHYPPHALHSAMNIIGTHDTERILTALGCAQPPESRAQRGEYRMTDAEYAKASALLQLASAIQFCFPGSPTIYYGDEAGMEGFGDPFCRGTFPWGQEDTVLQNWYRRLCAVRNGSAALRRGTLHFLHAEKSVLVFERCTAEQRVLCAVNRSAQPQSVSVPGEWKSLLDPTVFTDSIVLEPVSAQILEHIPVCAQSAQDKMVAKAK